MRLAALTLLNASYTTNGGPEACGPLACNPDADIMILAACSKVWLLPQLPPTLSALPHMCRLRCAVFRLCKASTTPCFPKCRTTSLQCSSMHATFARPRSVLTASRASMVPSCWARPERCPAQSHALLSWMPFLSPRLFRLCKVGGCTCQAGANGQVLLGSSCCRTTCRHGCGCRLSPSASLLLAIAGTATVQRAGVNYIQSDFEQAVPLNFNYKGVHCQRTLLLWASRRSHLAIQHVSPTSSVANPMRQCVNHMQLTHSCSAAYKGHQASGCHLQKVSRALAHGCGRPSFVWSRLWKDGASQAPQPSPAHPAPATAVAAIATSHWLLQESAASASRSSAQAGQQPRHPLPAAGHRSVPGCAQQVVCSADMPTARSALEHSLLPFH